MSVEWLPLTLPGTGGKKENLDTGSAFVLLTI